MAAANLLWRSQNVQVDAGTKPHIVFTTESKTMVSAYHEYVHNATKQSAFHIITNALDRNPDSGRPGIDASADADTDLLLAMASVKFQLVSRAILGNCCSNFHQMIHHFHVEGCGASRNPSFQCLQEVEDPRLRVCCWHSSGCKEERERQIASMFNNASAGG